jgi:protein-tyrosine-phosphatase
MSAKRKRKNIRILFVCTGNTCRSPLAEALLRERIGSEELGHRMVVSSAGLMAIEGSPASNLAVEVATENGLDLTSHRSRQLTEKILSNSDLVIGMQPSHLFPLQPLQQAGKLELHILGEYCTISSEARPDIPDPFGGNRAEYERAFTTIARCVDGLVEHLRIELGADSGKRSK